MEENSTPKTLQAEVVKRYMSDDQFALFINSYKNARHSIGGGSTKARKKNLATPLTENEIEFLKGFLTNFDESLEAQANNLGLDIKKGTYSNIVPKIAIRYLYQNMDKVGLSK